MAAVLPVARQEIEHLFKEAGRLGALSLAFLSSDGDLSVRWPVSPADAHGVGCLRLLAPMTQALKPEHPTLSWVCPHGVGFAASRLFVQSSPAGVIVTFGEASEQALTVARLLRLCLQQSIDLQQEMENLSNEISRNYEELNLHYEMAARLGTHPNAGPVYQHMVDQIRRMIRCDHIAILLSDEQGGLTSVYATDRAGRQLPPFRFGPNKGISGEVLKSGTSMIVCRTDRDPRFVAPPYPVSAQMSVPMTTSGKVLGVINLSDKEGGAEFSTNEMKLLETIARQAAIVLDNSRLFTDLRSLFLSAVKSLASAIDAKDPYTHGHSLRVAYYSTIIADGLSLPPDQREEVYLAAVLHDVGKIAIPESILLKPGLLTESEWEKMRQHPLHSAQILGTVTQFRALSNIVRHEHERYDGSGYPDGLKAATIPLASRIIAIADAYDAMTTNRSYRQGMAPDQAITALSKAVGTQFDPKVFSHLQSAFEQGRLALPPDVPAQFKVPE
ncbi:MAG TPA: HD domain-containing phosphohydrolase [Nitrospiria bacterium]|nr:HD domain-containing phosphohydrolase [Nitrospiria bacterium]